MMAFMHFIAPLLAVKAAWLALCGSRTLAHVHAGLAIYALAQVVWTRRAALRGLGAVALATLANEAFVALCTGGWRPEVRLSPAVMTMVWPAGLFALWHVRRWRWAEGQVRRDTPTERLTTPPLAPTRAPKPRLRLIPNTAVTPTPGAAPRLRVFPGYAVRPRA